MPGRSSKAHPHDNSRAQAQQGPAPTCAHLQSIPLYCCPAILLRLRPAQPQPISAPLRGVWNTRGPWHVGCCAEKRPSGEESGAGCIAGSHPHLVPVPWLQASGGAGMLRPLRALGSAWGRHRVCGSMSLGCPGRVNCCWTCCLVKIGLRLCIRPSHRSRAMCMLIGQ